jgi:hypothetical protein
MPKDKKYKLEKLPSIVSKEELDRLKNSLGEEYTPSPAERERIESEKKTYLKSPKEVLKTIKDEVMEKFSGAAVSEPEMDRLKNMKKGGMVVARGSRLVKVKPTKLY